MSTVTNSDRAELLALWLDDDLVRAEFEAIIAAESTTGQACPPRRCRRSSARFDCEGGTYRVIPTTDLSRRALDDLSGKHPTPGPYFGPGVGLLRSGVDDDRTT